METWRPELPQRPQVLSVRNLLVALGIHLAAFVGFYVFAQLHFHQVEKIIPIDLTVVVVENLDGNEDEPPPLQKPEPPPPPPKPKAEPPAPKPKPKEPEKPKELEKIVTNIVVKVEKQPAKPKPKPPKQPAKPEKSRAELEKERMAKMRKSVKPGKATKVQPNGRTEKKTLSNAEIQKLFNQGYRPGAKTQLATSVLSRCVSLIQRALDEQWERRSPSVGRSGTVLLSVQFNSNGGMVNVRLLKSCGDTVSDNAALTVARSVTAIRGLDPEFIAASRKEPATVKYEVQGR